MEEGMARRRHVWRLVGLAIRCLVLFCTAWDAWAQTRDDIERLNREIDTLIEAGKYAEALPLAKEAVQGAERIYYPDDVTIAGPLLKLGEVLSSLDRQAEAEPYERRALEIRERLL